MIKVVKKRHKIYQLRINLHSVRCRFATMYHPLGECRPSNGDLSVLIPPALMSGATTNIIFHASHIALDVIVSMRIIDNYIHYILFQQVFSD